MKRWKKPLIAGAASTLAVAAGITVTVATAPVTNATDLSSSTSPLQPPTITVNVNQAGVDPGDMFIVSSQLSPATPPTGGGTAPTPTPAPTGPEILDKSGRPIWFDQLPAGQQAGNFQVQTYQGQQVLTWWQGTGTTGHGTGVDYIADSHYHVIATVKPPGDATADIHEFRLLPDGHALLTSYNTQPADLSSVGGPADGQVVDSVVYDIDVATGAVVAQWDPLQHIPLTDSFEPCTSCATQPYDFFHLNSIDEAPDGQLLISARNTSAVYEIDPSTGAVDWTLGGKESSFTLGTGVHFSFQHDAEFVAPDEIRMFDDESNGFVTNGQSQIEWIHLDQADHTTSLVRAQTHPDGLTAFAMGNAQTRPDGYTFGGWGSTGHVAEFSADGQLVYDATLDNGGTTYRAFLQEWHATPSDPPVATVDQTSGQTTVHAVWNGATEVAHWRLLTGSSSSTLTASQTVTWNGLDTAIPTTDQTGWYEVQALDASGNVIGSSAPVQAG